MVLQGVPVHLSELLATTGVASLFGDGSRSHPPLPNDGTERWASLLNAPRTPWTADARRPNERRG